MQPTRESNTRSIGKPFDRGTAWMRLLVFLLSLGCTVLLRRIPFLRRIAG